MGGDIRSDDGSPQAAQTAKGLLGGASAGVIADDTLINGDGADVFMTGFVPQTGLIIFGGQGIFQAGEDGGGAEFFSGDGKFFLKKTQPLGGFDEAGGIVNGAFEKGEIGLDEPEHGVFTAGAAGIIGQEHFIGSGGVFHFRLAKVMFADFDAGFFAKITARGSFLDADEDFLGFAVGGKEGDAQEFSFDAMGEETCDFVFAFEGLGEEFGAGVLAKNDFVVKESLVIILSGDMGIATEEIGFDQKGVVGVGVDPAVGQWKCFLGAVFGDGFTNGLELTFGGRGIGSGLFLPLTVLKLELFLGEE